MCAFEPEEVPLRPLRRSGNRRGAATHRTGRSRMASRVGLIDTITPRSRSSAIVGRLATRSFTCSSEFGDMAEVDHRRAIGAAERQQHGEVTVGGYDDEVFCNRVIEDRRVRGGEQIHLHHVRGVVSGLS